MGRKNVQECVTLLATGSVPSSVKECRSGRENLKKVETHCFAEGVVVERRGGSSTNMGGWSVDTEGKSQTFFCLLAPPGALSVVAV